MGNVCQRRAPPSLKSAATPVSASPLVGDVPEHCLCYVMSFLHGFVIAGPPAVACRSFNAACDHERLCAHVLERDLAPEELRLLPQQPIRRNAPSAAAPRQHLLLMPEDLQDSRSNSRVSVLELRALTRALCNRSSQYIANLAAHDGRPALLLWAAGRACLENVDGSGHSALMVAAMHNRPVTVGVAAACCNLEQQYRQHGTALHMVAYVGAAEAALSLCREGADLEAVNGSFLQTPLLVACSRNHVEVARVLLDAQADPRAKDKDGLNALRIASMMRSEAAKSLIEEHLQG